ncbi:MAG TPA: hypothetical protein VKB85_06675 [Propionibacteriaceae bacterium]|nr:hypothetical protein [Propionibacteriaceae bacterium]
MYGPDEADPGVGPESARIEPPGMGANPSGPEFLPAGPPPSEPPPSLTPTGVWRPESTPHRRWPGVLSVSLIVAVALIVLVASAVARYRDAHVAAPLPVTVPSIRADPPSDGEIEFTTPEGSGRLILLSRSWRETGREQPLNGTYLLVEVKIVCSAGRLDYDPYNFQAFDHTGELFDVADAGITRQVLGVGELSGGQSTRGFLAFDVPRGEVTLLMSDDSDQSITALKIPA